jgi:Mrp family chromosome partitioning ATPase
MHSPVDTIYKKGIISNLDYITCMKKYEKETYDLLFSGREYYYAIRYKNSKVIRNGGSSELFVLDPITRILYIVETAD